jgi:PPM family protein phosphatase
MNPESITYLFETGIDGKQEDYIWPVAGEATGNDKVFIVCDGYGSFHSGGIASKSICQFMATKVLKITEREMSGELINKLLSKARDQLIAYTREYRLDTDLATTFSMLVLYNQKVLVSWYGDSRIYHMRDGVILFRTEDSSRNPATARGIRADSSPIYASTKWINDVRDGDYFLICSKGLTENITDEDIKLLLGPNDKENIDPAVSFRRLALEKTLDNYSMYLIKVKPGTQKIGRNGVFNAGRKPKGRKVMPIIVLALTIIAVLIIVIFFLNPRTLNPEWQFKNQPAQSVDVLRHDSVPDAINMSVPLKPVIKTTDSVTINKENHQETLQNDDSSVGTLQNDNSSVGQAEEKPDQTNELPINQKKRVGQLLLKFTTDESCKLKIANLDLDEVIDWDLSQYDNGTLYLKPGKYSILATSMIDSSKSKTYHFDVKPGSSNAVQSLRISF